MTKRITQPQTGTLAYWKDRALRAEAALRDICFMDLRPDFEDGNDIILSWKGNKADWERARAIDKASQS